MLISLKAQIILKIPKFLNDNFIVHILSFILPKKRSRVIHISWIQLLTIIHKSISSLSSHWVYFCGKLVKTSFLIIATGLFPSLLQAKQALSF